MKRIKLIVLATLTILALTATTAHAIPKKFKNCPSTKQDGITYLLYRDAAIVTKVPNRRVLTIPYSIRARGRRYKVTSIWEHTFECVPSLRTIYLRADVEAIEDPRIFRDRRVEVRTNIWANYTWLKRSRVNVRYVR